MRADAFVAFAFAGLPFGALAFWGFVAFAPLAAFAAGLGAGFAAAFFAGLAVGFDDLAAGLTAGFDAGALAGAGFATGAAAFGLCCHRRLDTGGRHLRVRRCGLLLRRGDHCGRRSLGTHGRLGRGRPAGFGGGAGASTPDGSACIRTRSKSSEVGR